MFSSTSATTSYIKSSSASFFALTVISVLPVVDIRFVRPIRLNRLLADAQESRSIRPRLYSEFRAVRTFVAAIFTVLEISLPLLRVAIKNFEPFHWEGPVIEGILFALEFILFSDHAFLLLHLLSLGYTISQIL